MRALLLVLISSWIQASAFASISKTFLYYNTEHNCGVGVSVEETKILDIVIYNGLNLTRHLSADTTKRLIDVDTRSGELRQDKIVLVNKEDLEEGIYHTVMVVVGDFKVPMAARAAGFPLAGALMQKVMPSNLIEARWFRESTLKKQEVGPVSDFFICRDMDLISTGVNL